MSDIDLPALVQKIRDHRFTGYTNNMLADEVDMFRSGQGISAISDAVGALKAVARALAETDETLRTELGKLGVEWRGDAGTLAWWAMSDEADFSEEAGATVDNSAERVFAQGEAFNRTLHKLPEAQALRVSLDGAGVTDFAFSLLGFETDHTSRLEQAREAREQALQALDAYARDSGDILVGVPEIPAPDRIKAVVSSTVPESIDAGGGPGDVTTAATASGPTPSGGAPGSTAVPPATGGVAGHNAPTPAMGMPAQQAPARSTGSATASPIVPLTPAKPSIGTTPSAATSGGIAGTADATGSARQTDQFARPQQNQQQFQTGQQNPQGQRGRPPRASAASGVGADGSGAADRTPRAFGGSADAAPPAAGGVAGRAVTPAAPAPPEQQLGKGLTSGAAQPRAGAAAGFGGTVAEDSPSRGEVSANDLGCGVAAMGAGGVAGSLSGDDEPKGRGVGRSAPGAARSPHQLPIGDLPEDEARVRRSSERLNLASDAHRRALLEKAAPGEDSGNGHVRRFGVDDNDLLTDQRMVAPDVIGDDGTDGNL